MTANSRVLAIATETSERSETPPKSSNPKAYFAFDFEKHMQKLLLNGDKPQDPDVNLIERFAATEIMRNGKQYYEFGPDNFKSRVIISGVSFNPKRDLLRVKDRVSKEHWVNENVIRYRKNSMQSVQQIVLDVLDEEHIEIYQYLRYLNDLNNFK